MNEKLITIVGKRILVDKQTGYAKETVMYYYTTEGDKIQGLEAGHFFSRDDLLSGDVVTAFFGYDRHGNYGVQAVRR